MLIWALLPALLLLSCRRNQEEGTDGPGLSIGIEFPFTPSTKAGAELSAEPAENVIHTLSVWVFRHDDEHTPVGHLTITDFPEGEQVKWYTMPVDWNFINKRPPVDVYVLANAASIDLQGLNGSSNWETVSGAVLGQIDNHDHFGVTEPVTSVDANGLPMSGMGENLSVYGSSPRLKVDAVSMKRAVSRMRMVFCRMATEGP